MALRGYSLTHATQDTVENVNRIISNASHPSLVPESWFHKITRKDGKPYVVAIIVLADIAYWYRGFETKDDNGDSHIRKTATVR